MRPNPQETADLINLLKKSLMENFIFYAVWENTQPENMRDIVFEKKKGYGGTVTRTRDYAEKAVRKVPQKRRYEKFRKIHKKKSVLELLFW